MNLKDRSPLITLIFTSVLCIAISIFSLKSGLFIVFQNIFYIPIIVSCFYYKKQGFALSVGLSFIYFFLITAFTSDPVIIQNAMIRVLLFIIIAAVVTALSLSRVRAEEALRQGESTDVSRSVLDASMADRRLTEHNRRQTEAGRRQPEHEKRKAEHDRRSHMISLKKRRQLHGKRTQELKWMAIIVLTAIIVTALIGVLPPQIRKLISIFPYLYF